MKPRTQTITSERVQELIGARKENLRRLNEIEHRLEFVEEYNGVEYVNDAKAMDLNSTWYSLESLDKPVIWICFGELDAQDSTLIAEIDLSSVKAAIVVGAQPNAMFRALSLCHGTVGHTDTMRQAVEYAMLIAENNEVVLFSPACPDFKLFKHYKEAGQQFRKDVREVRL